jgi:hypothetical protein
MSATMLSMPLEQHNNYHAKCNHFLFGKNSDLPLPLASMLYALPIPPS